MSAIFLLIPLSLLVALAFLGGFIWAVRSGQYEDTSTPAMRLLMDDEFPRPDGPFPGGGGQKTKQP
ncbi:MAG: cbb3-type cytochrome oxidase assembly protein CcoS [Verrucomicrobiales bacterium]|nr:cbb3-type cytochrome oxidase assembly protein CcoS [Verrucomicrobiales bacterium]MCP5526580.1 cbb3-type cytochrome oxidase assembly protein CcoS [Verrucomicrobiales bacterium]